MHGCALDIGNPSTSGKPTYVSKTLYVMLTKLVYRKPPVIILSWVYSDITVQGSDEGNEWIGREDEPLTGFSHATLCNEVRQCIEKGIEEVTSDLHYLRQAEQCLAFYCSESHEGVQEPHPAKIVFHKQQPQYLRCVLDTKTKSDVPKGSSVWFCEVSLLCCVLNWFLHGILSGV